MNIERKRRAPPNPLITEQDVRAIRSRLALGESARAIAPDYGLSPESIRKIGRRETWSHLP